MAASAVAGRRALASFSRAAARNILRPSCLAARWVSSSMVTRPCTLPTVTARRWYCVEKPEIDIPASIKYTTTHEWVQLSDDKKTARIGITDYAQKELGDICFVDVEQGDTEISKGDTLGSLEAVKTVADLVMPCSGEVTKVNDAVQSETVLINQDPYGKGWIVEILVIDPSQLDDLLDSEAYKKHIS